MEGQGIPVISLQNRDLRIETGSLVTASRTTQSSSNHMATGRKHAQADSADIELLLVSLKPR